MSEMVKRQPKMSDQAAIDATGNVIGTPVRDIRRDPDNCLSAFSVAWEMRRLGDIADVDPENLSYNTDPDYEFNYISLEQVDTGRLLGSTEVVFRTAPSRARRVLRENDILMSTVRPNLMAHLFFRGQIKNAICSTGFAVIRSKPNLSDPGFLFAHLFGHVVYQQVGRILAGSNYPAINTNDVRMIVIPCPPSIEEQQAIAEALSDVDRLLEALDALIAKKRAVKQAAMQQLLTGKARLPGFSGEWKAKRLEDIGLISGAGVDKKIDNDEIPVRLVNYLDVYHKTFLYSRNLTHEVSARQDQLRRCSVKKGDIFFTPTSEVQDDIGCSAVAMEDILDGAYSYHVVRLRLHVDWDLRFRAYVFNTKRFRDQASKSCEGSGTRYVITLAKFRAMTVHLPPTKEEQAAIAAVLSDMDAEIAALERRRDKTRTLKQGMMQQLLTGRTRLLTPG